MKVFYVYLVFGENKTQVCMLPFLKHYISIEKELFLYGCLYVYLNRVLLDKVQMSRFSSSQEIQAQNSLSKKNILPEIVRVIFCFPYKETFSIL